MTVRRLIVAILFVAALAAMVGGILFWNPKPPAPSPAPATTGEATTPAGRFVAADADFTQVAPLDPAGQPVDMAPYRGKALLVNLWATWCAPCVKELPSLGKLQAALGGADFAVVAIAVDERDPAKVTAFLADHGAGNLPALIDTNRTVDKAIQAAALPTSLLVDPAGKVRAVLTGDASWHCGNALEAVKSFIADGTVMGAELDLCE